MGRDNTVRHPFNQPGPKRHSQVVRWLHHEQPSQISCAVASEVVVPQLLMRIVVLWEVFFYCLGPMIFLLIYRLITFTAELLPPSFLPFLLFLLSNLT